MVDNWRRGLRYGHGQRISTYNTIYKVSSYIREGSLHHITSSSRLTERREILNGCFVAGDLNTLCG